MKYFRGWTTLPVERTFPAVTDNAIAFTIAGGYTTANDTHMWLPKSQIIIGEPNEYGNAEILIPYWLMKKKALNPFDLFHRMREIGFYNGEEIIDHWPYDGKRLSEVPANWKGEQSCTNS